MRTKINLLLFITVFVFKLNAQVVLYESFTAPFNPSASGWDVQNLSSATGTNATGWMQGIPAKFPALVGAPADYYAADMNATGALGTTNTISCWLLTPTLNLVNGAIIQFATLGSILPAAKADRMQLYYSFGNGNNVGTTAGTATNTAGTFTNIITDLNAALQPMGYPSEWAVYTFTLSGIATPTVGRLGFRYYVPNGGAAGANGNYIGIDDFRYMNACPRPSYFASWTSAICTNNPLSLSASNGGTLNPITSYTWSNGANTSTTTVVPTHTGITSYYCLAQTTPGCVSLSSVNAWAVATPTVTFARNPAGNICAGSSVTLSASGATTYTYDFGSGTTSTINPIDIGILYPTTTVVTQFTLSGKGSSNNCINKQVLTFTIVPSPTISVAASATPICINKTTTLTASGAASYTWSGTVASTVNPLTYTATTTGVKNFTINGLSADGCKAAMVVQSVTVSACTGIEEVSFASAGIYPNPFTNELNLSAIDGSAALYNSLGQLVLTIQPDDRKIIETANLAKGLYILKVYNTGNALKQMIKLVKE